MANLWQFSQGHPKPAFSEKLQRGYAGKFFKNRLKSSLRLKGSKALWRKLHDPLFSMHLKCKDWKGFWRKQRLQSCPNGQVTSIFARSPKIRIFWKSAKGVPNEISQNLPKSSPPSNGPKALRRKWHYPLISMHLKCKDWGRFWRKKRLKECPKLSLIHIWRCRRRG